MDKKKEKSFSPVMQEHSEIYSQDVIQSFVENFGFPESAKKGLRVTLEFAGRNYWEQTLNPGLTPTEIKRLMGDVVSTIGSLKSMFDKIDGDTWATLRDISVYKRGDWLAPQIFFEPEGALGPPDPQIELCREIGPGEPGQITEDITSFSKLLAQLEAFAKIANDLDEELPEKKRGPEPNWPLRWWVREMAEFWEEFSPDEFTRDEHKGEPLSKAAIFCVEAFSYVDPKTRSATVLNAMKEVMKQEEQEKKDYWGS